MQSNILNLARRPVATNKPKWLVGQTYYT